MIGKIRKHELRKVWQNEAIDFTTWLEKNLDVISEAVGIEITLIKREQEVGSFYADILAIDELGQKVIIENQLERTDHTHLGQIITYISNLDGKTVIWISSDPRQEHINAINWLNAQTQLNFYLLKIEAISIDDSNPAAHLQVICKPDEDIKKAVASISELNEREKFNLQFWTEVSKKCEGKLPGFAYRKSSKYPFHSQASGKGGISFSFLATSKFYGIDLYIDTGDGNLNESLLNQLKAQKSEIEKEYGHQLHFDDIPNKRACRIRHTIKEGIDVMDENRDLIQDELIQHMIKFEKILKPRIKKLDYNDIEAA